MSEQTMATACSRMLILCTLMLSACGSRQAFDTSYPVNRSDDLSAVLARAKATKRRDERPVIVGVTSAPAKLFAYDLGARRMLFERSAEMSGVPIAAGGFVISPERASLQVRDLDSGASLLEVALDGMHLVGADSDGEVTAIALSTGGSMGARSRLVVLRGTAVTTNQLVERPIGGPAVLSGLVFVPNNRVHLSVLDEQGYELARIAVKDDVASQAIAQGNDVYFGLLGVYRLDEHTTDGVGHGANYLRVTREEKLPGQPSFLPDTTLPPPSVGSAVHRVALSFLPEHGPQGLGLVDDTLYLVFYRQIFGLDARSSGARWVAQIPSDVVGMRSVPGGVIAVDEQGTVRSFDTEGRERSTTKLGVSPVVARIRANRFDAGTASAEPAPPLAAQLASAALNPDGRLVPSRVLAVHLLAGLDEDDATSALIEICEDHAVPERVRTTACVSISKRSTGSEAVIAALARHADYLTQTKAPPVGPLAEAALRAQDARAVPHLLAHLDDPETEAEELPALMLALAALADASAAAKIADFLRLYHADADDSRVADALVTAVETIAKLTGPNAQSVLEPIASDTLTTPSVRAAASRALANLAPAPIEEGEAKNATPEQPAEPAPVIAPTPERLTSADVDRALLPIKEELSQCVRRDARRPMSARLTIVVEANGRVALVQALPESLSSCVEPLVKGVTFPMTLRGKRDVLSTTITR